MDTNREGVRSITDEAYVRKPKRAGLTIQLLMFTFFLAKTFADTIIVNLLERNTCLAILNYDWENCTDPVSPATEGLEQQSTANIVMVRTIIEAFVPSLLSLLIGPWSDTNGRRPLILLSLSGYLVSTLMWCLMTLIPRLHPLYFLLTSVPVILSGGYVSFFLALTCYISDTTENHQRAFRMGMLEAACIAGVLISSLLTPYLLASSANFGYTVVFAVSFSLILVVLLCTYFFIEESVNVIESERTKLWRIDHVKEIFKTCFRSRLNNIRTVVLSIIINLMLVLIIMEGEMSVVYMYTQKEFGWTLVEFTRFSSLFLLVAGLSVVGSTWLLVSVLKFTELPLMFAGTLCMVSKSLMQAVATSGLYFYVSSCFNVLSVLITPLSRSQLSKLIPPEDLGKIFAFTAFLESTAPVTASPLYVFVYKATMDSFPNTVFWLSTGLCLISTLLIGSSLMLHRFALPVDHRPLLANESEDGSCVQT